MTTKRVTVRQLAKELGVTSRQIIDRCRANGLPVQNSITGLKPDDERTVRTWFESRTTSAPCGRGSNREPHVELISYCSVLLAVSAADARQRILETLTGGGVIGLES